MGDTSICRVESVMVGDKAVLVDAQNLNRPSVVYRNTPLLADFSGIMTVPKPGQRVVVSKDSSGFEYVEGVLSGPDDPVSDLKEDELVMQFDPSTKIEFSKDGSGGYNISLEASGDVDVKAGGDIRVGENGDPVAKQNHTHSYEDTGDTGDGSATPTAKTSSTPNESGTNTTIK